MKVLQLATINISFLLTVGDHLILITKLPEMMFFPKDICVGEKKTRERGLYPVSDLLRDVLHERRGTLFGFP